METSKILPIRQLRVRMDKSQEQMAEILQIKSPKTYANYENGLQSIPSDILVKMAQYFDVSTDYLLGVSDYTKDGNKYISSVTGLSDKAINALRNYKKNDAEISKDFFDAVTNGRQPSKMMGLTMPILNRLITSSNFKKLIDLLHIYSSDTYQIPIFDNGNSYKIFPSYTDKEKDFLYFGCNPNNPSDNVQIQIDEDFRKSVTKDLMEKTIDKISDELKKI